MKKSAVLLSVVLLPAFAYAESLIMLNLPKTGAPDTRIGGGTRDIGGKFSISIQTLAPTQVGLTLQASPTLYWYISAVVSNPIEFSLVTENNGDFIVEKILSPVSKSGIQTIKLSDLNIQLEKGKEYRWTIAVVNDDRDRGKDIITSATIRREDTNIALNDVKQLAAAGIWYDLLQTLYEQKSPQIPDLLKQVDIVIGN